MTNTNSPDHWTPAELVGAPAYLHRAAKDYAEAYALAALAQSGRVVGTVTGYQTASGAQQWQFNPSNVAGLENQRFEVALSTPTAPKEEKSARVVDESTLDAVCERHSAALLSGLTSRKAMRRALETFLSTPTAAPAPSQAAVTELKRWFMNPETGMLVQTERGPWVRYVDVMEALAAYAKKEGQL